MSCSRQRTRRHRVRGSAPAAVASRQRTACRRVAATHRRDLRAFLPICKGVLKTLHSGRCSSTPSSLASSAVGCGPITVRPWLRPGDPGISCGSRQGGLLSPCASGDTHIRWISRRPFSAAGLMLERGLLRHGPSASRLIPSRPLPHPAEASQIGPCIPLPR